MIFFLKSYNHHYLLYKYLDFDRRLIYRNFHRFLCSHTFFPVHINDLVNTNLLNLYFVLIVVVFIHFKSTSNFLVILNPIFHNYYPYFNLPNPYILLYFKNFFLLFISLPKNLLSFSLFFQ
jgi:hypothetical protein